MKTDFLRNFPFGVFLGVVVATIAFLVLDDNYSSGWAKYFAYGVTAILSLFAAALSLFGVFISIDNQRSLEAEKRRGALAAARATLPLALSNLIAISRKGIDYSLNEKEGRSFNDLADELVLKPEFISILTRVIEFSDVASGERLSDIVRRHQVLTSRLRGWDDPHFGGPNEYNRAEAAANWAIQYRLVEDAFDYARGISETIPEQLSNKNIASLFWVSLGLTYSDDSALGQAIIAVQEAPNPELL